MTVSPIKQYLNQLEIELTAGRATEHTHRPALKKFIEALVPGLTATNEPKRVECGAPDFVVSRNKGLLTIGHIEAKDIGKSLDQEEHSDQLQRFLNSLDNLILTDYLEFRWYVNGEHRNTARCARLGRKNKLVCIKEAEKETIDLLGDFLSHTPKPIASPRELAEKMARLTHLIRDIIIEAFNKGRASQLLLDLREAFAKTLLPDLDQPGRVAEFTDMYAQTIAYGLFAARCNHPSDTPFQRLGAGGEIPKTNPFLRQLFDTITGADFEDEPYVGFVDDLAQVLANVAMPKILADFGKRASQQDPIMHFYETFLASYDPKLREVRGVYYTPEPAVSYIVRSIDHILRTRFKLAEGLATTATIKVKPPQKNGQGGQKEKTYPRVLILDPGCGTGTFLYAIVDHIRQEFIDQGNAGMWADYVKTCLLPRMFGFELLMAPYAVAHFKLAMQLAAQDLAEPERKTWACDLSDNVRLGIYLTNTLEEIDKQLKIPLYGPLRVIAEEAKAADRIKHELPIMVILGNPPYSGHSANRSWIMKDGKRLPTFIGKLVQDYYYVDGQPLGERNPKWLQDDYVKFIRWAQWRIDQTGAGILAFITNHGYLDNSTFRGMRQLLMKSFNKIYILDLHGSVKKREHCPDGSKDENVFDIQQGVAIGIFIKEHPGKKPAQVYHADLWGLREHKYDELLKNQVKTTRWHQLQPKSPLYPFTWQDTDIEAEYADGWKLTDIFPLNSAGIVTARDHLTIHWSRDDVWVTINDFASLPAEEARQKYNLRKDVRDWQVSLAQADVCSSGPQRSKIAPILYRPFDIRYTYYTKKTRGFICMPRSEVMSHMLPEGNLGLITVRKAPPGSQCNFFMVTQAMISNGSIRSDNQSIDTFFPLYLYPKGKGKKQPTLSGVATWPLGKDNRVPNLGSRFIGQLEKNLKMKFTPDGTGDLKNTFGPEDVLNYIYAIFYSETYRQRYAQELKKDFPRIPLTRDKGLFSTLCSLGKQLVSLHLMQSPPKTNLKIRYPVTGSHEVERGHPKYNEPAKRVYINKDQYFEGVPSEVWNSFIGGYQVSEKWLKDRRGRRLAYDERMHYEKIVIALNETIKIMASIDQAIPSWPIK